MKKENKIVKGVLRTMNVDRQTDKISNKKGHTCVVVGVRDAVFQQADHHVVVSTLEESLALVINHPLAAGGLEGAGQGLDSECPPAGEKSDICIYIYIYVCKGSVLNN